MRHHHHHGAHAPGLAAPELACTAADGLAPLGTPGAAPAGLSLAHKDEAHRLAGAAGFRGQGTADNPDCAQSAHPVHHEQPTGDDAKRFATLRARLALAGWTLTRHDASGGPVSFYACRWNMPRELADLAAVEAFADCVGAPA